MRQTKLTKAARGRDCTDWKSGLPYDVIRENRRRELEAAIKRIQSEEGAVFLADYPSYLVTPAGDVYSIATSRLRKLRPGTKPKGYRFVGVGGDKYEMVHRLVAKAFIPNPACKPEVNHKDGDKQNNHVANLEWATRSENAQHGHDNGLMAQGADHHATKLGPSEVLEILSARGRYRDIGARYGVCAQTVCNIKRKRIHKRVIMEAGQ